MKTEIETTGTANALKYPCLMITKTGAVIMYVTAFQGTVLHTTGESNWKVGDEVRNNIKHMASFSGVLRLWN